MINRAVLAAFFKDHEFQWRINDRPIGIARFNLQRFGIKHLCVELNGFFEIVNIEGKL